MFAPHMSGRCFQLDHQPTLHGRCLPLQGVPDYWFAANSTSLHLVFDGLLAAFAAGDFKPEVCGVLHGIYAGRLAQARRLYGLELGRYGYHEMDSTIANVISSPPCLAPLHATARNSNSTTSASIGALDNRSGLAVWAEEREERGVSYTYAVDEPRLHSVCPSSVHYCGCAQRFLQPFVERAAGAAYPAIPEHYPAGA